MSVGLMMLPAICSRLWAATVGGMLLAAFLIAALAGMGGLLLSYHVELPSGPCIILLAGLFYIVSLFVAPQGGVLPRLLRQRHLES
jgi:zinc/manganese transport system permease protein